MRMPRTTKNNTIKLATTLPDSSSKTDTSSQTPIEIALKIDENGMTTASNLYSFLELNPTQFSRWCKRNIVNNKFATENVDYICFDISVDSAVKGQTKTDYKITSDFAKKLSMTGNTERHEQARQYFIACEQGLKVAAQRLQSNSNHEINEKLVELLTSMDNRLSKLEEQSKSAIETTYKKPYNPWFAKMQPKYKLLEKYFDTTRGQLYKNILWELENLYDINTQQIQADYCYENNLISCQPLDPFEYVPKYRDMIEQIVNSNLIKYGIASEDDPITSTKHITIFDTPVIDKEGNQKREVNYISNHQQSKSF